MDEKIQEIKRLCEPLVDFIQQNYDPYTEIVISDSFIKVVNTNIGIPVTDENE